MKSKAPADTVTGEQPEHDQLQDLFCMIGEAYRRLCTFDCESAIKLLRSLPSHHVNSGWIYNLIARCYFELAEYTEVGFSAVW